MKVSKIEIRDFNQFKNFTIDLTYPMGHKKAGLPLDKVCFIGQSGTGKTTLLNIIEELINSIGGPPLDFGTTDIYKIEFVIDLLKTKCHSIKYKIDDKHENYNTKYDDYEGSENVTEFDKEKNANRLKYIYFHANIDEGVLYLKPKEKENQHIVTMVDIENAKKQRLEEIKRFEQQKFVQSKNFKEADFWTFVLKKLEEYDFAVKEKGLEVINNAFDKEVEKVLTEINAWKISNPNPRKKLAKHLDYILNEFEIKINSEWNKDGEIKLQHLNDTDIPFDAASSGTKRICLTSLPLYFLDTENSIILFDEVENSLYPDIQAKIINHYSNLAPNSQFFFATHSPIIASQFEPWEIVELKYNETHTSVFQVKYYNGENHVNNYFKDPRIWRWDTLFMKMFGLQEEGNPERKKRLNELSEIGIKLQNLKKQDKNNSEEAKKLWDDYKKLAELLDWKID